MNSARHRGLRLDRTDAPMAILGAAVLVLTLCATYLSTISVNGSAFSAARTLTVQIASSAPIVRPGDEVRLDGERVGYVRSVGVGRGFRVAQLQVHTSSLRRDASVRVRLRGLAGAVALELSPGRARAPLANRATISLAHSAAGTQVTDVIA